MAVGRRKKKQNPHNFLACFNSVIAEHFMQLEELGKLLIVWFEKDV